MDDGRLLQVRCPLDVTTKSKKLVRCNKLCVKVFPGSSGEIVCPRCRRKFRFYVDSQAKSILSVKAQEIPMDSE